MTNFFMLLILTLPYTDSRENVVKDPYQTKQNSRALSIHYVDDEYSEKPSGKASLKDIKKRTVQDKCPVIMRAIEFCMLCQNDIDCRDMKCCPDVGKNRTCCLNLKPIAVIVNSEDANDTKRYNVSGSRATKQTPSSGSISESIFSGTFSKLLDALQFKSLHHPKLKKSTPALKKKRCRARKAMKRLTEVLAAQNNSLLEPETISPLQNSTPVFPSSSATFELQTKSPSSNSSNL